MEREERAGSAEWAWPWALACLLPQGPFIRHSWDHHTWWACWEWSVGKRCLTQAVREGLSDKVVFRQRPRGLGSRPCRSPEEVHLGWRRRFLRRAKEPVSLGHTEWDRAGNSSREETLTSLWILRYVKWKATDRFGAEKWYNPTYFKRIPLSYCTKDTQCGWQLEARRSIRKLLQQCKWEVMVWLKIILEGLMIIRHNLHMFWGKKIKECIYERKRGVKKFQSLGRSKWMKTELPLMEMRNTGVWSRVCGKNQEFGFEHTKLSCLCSYPRGGYK